jgi:hypothetical protein
MKSLTINGFATVNIKSPDPSSSGDNKLQECVGVNLMITMGSQIDQYDALSVPTKGLPLSSTTPDSKKFVINHTFQAQSNEFVNQMHWTPGDNMLYPEVKKWLFENRVDYDQPGDKQIKSHAIVWVYIVYNDPVPGAPQEDITVRQCLIGSRAVSVVELLEAFAHPDLSSTPLVVECNHNYSKSVATVTFSGDANHMIKMQETLQEFKKELVDKTVFSSPLHSITPVSKCVETAQRITAGYVKTAILEGQMKEGDPMGSQFQGPYCIPLSHMSTGPKIGNPPPWCRRYPVAAEVYRLPKS